MNRGIAVVLAAATAGSIAGCGGSSHSTSSSRTEQSDASVGSCVRIVLVATKLGDKSSGCSTSEAAVINKVAGPDRPGDLKVVCTNSTGHQYSCQATATGDLGVYKSQAGSYNVVDDGQNISIQPR